VNAWLGYYFYIYMSIMSYIFSAIVAPFLAISFFFMLNTLYFPFYNTPASVMLLTTAIVRSLSHFPDLLCIVQIYVIAYPHMPYRLRKKSELKKEVLNSLVTLDFFMLVFIVNRLLVLNFGRRDTTSLMVLSVIYPLLVSRSKTDCSRLAEAFNRKSIAAVEAFFTYVSSIFQVKSNPRLLLDCTRR